jgi:uncharacterized protein
MRPAPGRPSRKHPSLHDVVGPGERKERDARMSNTPHDLHEEFPDQGDRIHRLKTTDAHFARLIDDYNELNRTIHRVESRVEPTTEDVEEDLKRRRVHLKDEIARKLAKAD